MIKIKVDYKKLLISGILSGIVMLILSMIVVNFFVQMLWPYDIFSLGGMRAMTDPLMMFFFGHYFVLGITFAYVFPYVKQNLSGTFIQKGLKFGWLMWLVAGLPSAYVVYTSMNYPIGFTFDSVVGSLIYMIASGIIIAKFMD